MTPAINNLNDSATTILVVPADTRERRLDRFLAGELDTVSRSAVGRLIQDGRVTVNGVVPHKRGYSIEPGDSVTITGALTGGGADPLAPEQTALAVLYEDDDLLAIDKPSGVAVHPGPGHSTGTLVNALLGRHGPLSSVGGDERPGIVHRLDKDTSGVILVAKTNAAHQNLANQFQARTVQKAYVTLLRGRLEPERGVIRAPIARDPHHRQRMAVVTVGRDAVTDYQVLTYVPGGYTLAEARPHTGRPHQIRVHFASLRHPVAGDRVYARGGRDPVPRLFLHAQSLRFRHPRDAHEMTVRCPLANDLMENLEQLTAGTPDAAIAETLR